MFKLELENEMGEIVNIDDGVNYIVVGCSGLNPPSASLFTSKSPNKKGLKHNGSSLNERNIVLQVKILGDIEANRNALYSWVDTEQYVKIRYANGLKKVYCEGYVQDCDADLFTDNEIISFAIVCGDPFWKELQEISIDISTLVKHFTFPFAIDSEGIPFSTLNDSNITSVLYTGVETGVKIVVYFKDTVKNFSIFDGKDGSRMFKLNHTCDEGYILEIDTENSPKRCRLIAPDKTEENALKYVEGRPTWFTLKKGYNEFGYTADEGVENVEVVISFTNKFLGV